MLRVGCPLCGGSKFSIASRRAGWLNHRLTNLICRNCGFTFREKPLERAKAERFYKRLSRYYRVVYGQDRLAASATETDETVMRRVAWMRGWLSPGARILDVGAGTGRLVAALRQAGFAAEGIDLDEAAVAYAQKQGLPVQALAFEEGAWPDGAFDALGMFHVLEHCADLRLFLRQARRLLRDNGLLFIELPDLLHIHHKPEFLLVPEHNWHFTATTLGWLLAQEGFGVDSLTLVPEPRGAADSLAVVARKARLEDAAALAAGPEEYERVCTALARARRETRLAYSEQLRDLLTRLLGPTMGFLLYRIILGCYLALKRAVGLYREPQP